MLNTSGRSAYLNAFNSLDPNGTWTLFIADLSSGDTSTLVSWELDITAIPEPAHWALGIFAVAFAGVQGWRAWRQRRAV